MKIGRSKGWFVMAMALAAGCTGAPSATQQGMLSASPSARAFGVDHYAASAEGALLFDKNGIELGRMVLSADETHRLISVELIDGAADELEVNKAKGALIDAPVWGEGLAATLAADVALAPILEDKLAVRFHPAAPTSQGTQLGAETVWATTTSCSAYNTTTPTGCAKPANTSLGCSNESSSPATAWTDAVDYYYMDCWTACAMANGYQGAGSYCWDTGDGYCAVHYVTTSFNRWDAKCPRSACGTQGGYDRVPRQGSCYYYDNTCSYSTGTVSCW